MAEIYEARNPFSGKSLLAKVTRSKPESRANLNNEQRILNKIQNKKGIPTRSVSMIDHGTRDNEHFLILERLPGMDLHDFLKSQKVPFGFNQFVLMATEILLAIETVHALKVIHRDIKPTNLRYDVNQTVYNRMTCMDFGISLALGESLLELPNPKYLKCRSGGYSPPEAADESQSAHPTFDIYSVGAIMYYCATLENPPSKPSSEGLHPRISLQNFNKKLNDWVAKCTHPIPAKRFQTAREAIERLHAIQAPKTEPWIATYTTQSNAPSKKYSVQGLKETQTPLDLVIMIDSTDSMDPYRKEIESNVKMLSELLFSVFADLKITIIGLGDYESSDTLQLTSVRSHAQLVKAVSSLSSVSGGGDDAEAYEFAFSVLNRTDKHNLHEWRKNAGHMIIVIGDSFSHAFPAKMPFIRGAPGPGGMRTKQFNLVEAEFDRFCKRQGLNKDEEWPKFKSNNFKAKDNWGSNIKQGQIIPTTNKLLRKLHSNKDGNVYRPNIDKAIHNLKERQDIRIHTIHCGKSEISEKFFRYLSVRGEGVALKLDNAEDIVAVLSALILTNDPKNYQQFISQLSDEQTSLLQPATTLVQKG